MTRSDEETRADLGRYSGDEYHTAALKLYMDRFDFTHNALDVALRMLLMQMSLPRETQQIDRIIEAFANRYEECEPGLFTNKGEYSSGNCMDHMLILLRQHLCFGVLDDDATYGRVQQEQQEQDDQSRLREEHPYGWCPSSSARGERHTSDTLKACSYGTLRLSSTTSRTYPSCSSKTTRS